MTDETKVTVYATAEGVPVIELPDRRMFARGRDLADAILAAAAANPPAPPKETLVRAFGAALAHQSYTAAHGQGMAALHAAVQAQPTDDPATVLERMRALSDHARRFTEGKGTPSARGGGSNGLAVAHGGANAAVLGGSTEDGEWFPGEGLDRLAKGLLPAYPEDHLIHRLFNAIMKVV